MIRQKPIAFPHAKLSSAQKAMLERLLQGSERIIARDNNATRVRTHLKRLDLIKETPQNTSKPTHFAITPKGIEALSLAVARTESPGWRDFRPGEAKQALTRWKAKRAVELAGSCEKSPKSDDSEGALGVDR